MKFLNSILPFNKKEKIFRSSFNEDNCFMIKPDVGGWLEYRLNQEELDYVWRCVNDKKFRWNNNLAGNIESSFLLEDKDDWFFKNTLVPLYSIYQKQGGVWKSSSDEMNIVRTAFDSGYKGGKESKLEINLHNWWVNYQCKHEFNPAHFHYGFYSFVLWLKIPVEFQDQNKDSITNTPVKSAFQFTYSDIMGRWTDYCYQLGKKYEGTLLFFPSKLIHQVYPFYNSDKERISVSGNLAMKAIK